MSESLSLSLFLSLRTVGLCLSRLGLPPVMFFGRLQGVRPPEIWLIAVVRGSPGCSSGVPLLTWPCRGGRDEGDFLQGLVAVLGKRTFRVGRITAMDESAWSCHGCHSWSSCLRVPGAAVEAGVPGVSVAVGRPLSGLTFAGQGAAVPGKQLCYSGECLCQAKRLDELGLSFMLLPAAAPGRRC